MQEGAVRLLQKQRGAHESQWAAISSIAGKLGCTAEALRRWVRRAERDAGERPESLHPGGDLQMSGTEEFRMMVDTGERIILLRPRLLADFMAGVLPRRGARVANSGAAWWERPLKPIWVP